MHLHCLKESARPVLKAGGFSCPTIGASPKIIFANPVLVTSSCLPTASTLDAEAPVPGGIPNLLSGTTIPLLTPAEHKGSNSEMPGRDANIRHANFSERS